MFEIIDAPVQPAPPPKVGPIAFKLLFTIEERLVIKTLRLTDPVVIDLYEMLDDPRTDYVDLSLTSIQKAVHYCLTKVAEKEVIAAADVEKRTAQVISGEMPS